MRRILLLLTALSVALLVACGEDKNNNEELALLEVDFDVPETAEVGETVELIATVTYGDELVTDADEVLFEIWERGKQDEGEKLDGVNHEDGTYTIEYTFDRDGVFEMYAHTTAHSLHTMPKKEIIVGEGGDYEEEGDGHAHHFHTEGFDLHFMEPDNIVVGDDIELMTHVTLNEEGLKDAKVRYEVWKHEDEDNTEWIDATEENAGEYVANYSFAEKGTYHIQIHVEDDEDLHEHAEYEVEVE